MVMIVQIALLSRYAATDHPVRSPGLDVNAPYRLS